MFTDCLGLMKYMAVEIIPEYDRDEDWESVDSKS